MFLFNMSSEDTLVHHPSCIIGFLIHCVHISYQCTDLLVDSSHMSPQHTSISRCTLYISYHLQLSFRTFSTQMHIVNACCPHICRFIHHPHIICSTPHGHHSSKLSFHCDRNWLLNRICHKNVELFHFRII